MYIAQKKEGKLNFKEISLTEIVHKQEEHNKFPKLKWIYFTQQFVSECMYMYQ